MRKMSVIVISSVMVIGFGLQAADLNVYFTHSVDTTLANPTPAQGDVKLDQKLINRISAAQYTIDFCFYDIDMHNIADSLIAAFNNGIEVRVITDNECLRDTLYDTTAIYDLNISGIEVIDDSFGGNAKTYDMHNKFAVFDFRDSASTNDDWVWTGSYNATNNGTNSNANNAIEIQDHELAQAYTVEFEEMWGSDSLVPNPDSSKFHKKKTDNTQHKFNIGGIPVELYFSPSDHATAHICSTILTGDTTIYFCIFSYTLQDVSDTMKARWDSTDIAIAGVFDNVGWGSIYSERWDMQGIDTIGSNPWNPPAPVYEDSVDSPSGPKFLHHKYMTVDVDCNSDPVLITGSQNWSTSGEEENDENTLIIHSQDITNQYYQEFAERYREAGGEIGCAEYDNIINQKGLRALPNPFYNSLKVEGYLGMIKVYDISGRFIGEFTNQWDGKDLKGIEVRAGIYFLIPENKVFKTIKVIKLK